jgi:hypothetical protein
MSDFVLPVRKGGLGNQLFQVSAAVIYAKETNRQVVLPLEQPHVHTTGLDYRDTVFHEFPRMDRVMDGTAIEQLKAAGFSIHPGEPGFEPWSIHNVQGNILLHGYFQYYPPIGKYEEEIRRLFLEGLPIIKQNSRCVGIHVRRGDFLKPPHSEVHYVQTEAYYQKSLKYFNTELVSFKIFSDDLPWCKSQPFFQKLVKKEFVEEPNEINALARMAECAGGFICANSTFSWWGAFLGAYQFRAPICVPKDWMRGHDTRELFPREWIHI